MSNANRLLRRKVTEQLKKTTRSKKDPDKKQEHSPAEKIGRSPFQVSAKSSDWSRRAISSYLKHREERNTNSPPAAADRGGTRSDAVREKYTGAAPDKRRYRATEGSKCERRDARRIHNGRASGRKNNRKKYEKGKASFREQGKAQMKDTAAKTAAKKSTAAAVKQANAAKRAARKARVTMKVVRFLLSLGVWGGVFIIVFAGIAALLSSALGIFDGTQPDAAGQASVRQVVMDLNRAYNDEILKIKEQTPHDVIRTSDVAIDWKQVLSIYSVLTAEEGNGVVAMDAQREARLHRLFWEMNGLEAQIVQEPSEIQPTEPKPGPQKPGKPAPVLPRSAGNSSSATVPPSEPIPQKKTVLLIRGTHKTAAEMLDTYGLSDEQKEMVMALTSPENDRYWQELVYGSTAIPNRNGWVQPLEKMVVGSPYGYRVHPITGEWRLHAGVDLEADTGLPIMAAKDGQVVAALYEENGAGNYVVIDHGDGVRTIYMHMQQFTVRWGQTVKAGDIIGFAGSTGLSTGPHLHFGVDINGEYVDPMQLYLSEPDTYPTETTPQT